MSWWWDWWLDFLWLRYLLEWYRQMICHWTLNLVSHGYVKETMTFRKTQNRFHCNGIWITDIFSQWFSKSVTASDIHIFLHILLLMMIRIFSGQLRNYLFIFRVEYRYWQTVLQHSLVLVWGIRGVRSLDGNSVLMLAWNVKFRAQRVKVSYPTFSFHISLSTLQHTEVKMLTKKFWSTLWWPLRLTVMFTWKAESFRVPCFWCLFRKRYSWTLYHIVYSNINLD